MFVLIIMLLLGCGFILCGRLSSVSVFLRLIELGDYFLGRLV